MTRKIAVINQKGGVGKTTTTANLGFMMARKGYKVTLIDLDPQSSLTVSMGVDWQEAEGIEDVLLHDVSLETVAVQCQENLRLIPSGNNLAQMEHLSNSSSDVAKKMRILLDQMQDDYVLVDCPPSSGFLIVSALYATREVLIPIAADYLTLHGLSHLMGTLISFEERLGHVIKKWFVITRFHPRRRLSNEVKEKLIEYFPGKILKTSIRESSSLAEAPGQGMTVYEYKKSSNGSYDYQNLADDLCLERTL